MIPTFVFGWPTGQEKGDFLALDLGEWSDVYATFPGLQLYSCESTSS